MTDWIPTPLPLPHESEIAARSMTKALLHAETYWPDNILNKDVVKVSVLGNSLHHISCPLLARTILKAGDDVLPKAYFYDRVLGSGVGKKSLSAASGQQSKKLRKQYSPLFSSSVVTGLLPMFSHYTQLMTDRWSDGQRLDISHEAQGVTLRVISHILFGERDEKAPLPGIIDKIVTPLHKSLVEGHLRRQTELFDQGARGLLHYPPKDPIFPGNPYAANSDSAGALSEEEKLHNLRMFMASGSETTALTLTWCLWILGQQPELQEALGIEIDKQLARGPFTTQKLQQIPFLNQVLYETLRLYPTAPLTARQATQDVEVGGYRFQKGNVIAINFYGINRNPKNWSNAESFIPQRFENNSAMNLFFPFSYGPYSCIGSQLGKIESMAILVRLLQKFRFEAEDDVVTPRSRITLRPQKPVWLKVYHR